MGLLSRGAQLRLCSSITRCSPGSVPVPKERVALPPAVRRLLLRRNNVTGDEAKEMEELWPLCLRAERQEVATRAAELLSKRSTFDTTIYHVVYSRYLGEPIPVQDVVTAVQRGGVHWTELLLIPNPPPIPVLREHLRQLGVEVGGTAESLALWLLFLAKQGERRWGEVSAELSHLSHHYDTNDEDTASLVVNVFAAGGEVGEVLRVLQRMDTEGLRYSPRAFTALMSPHGIDYDICHGFPPASPHAASFRSAVRDGIATTSLALHAVLVYLVRRHGHLAFWEVVRCAPPRLIHPDSLELIFGAWAASARRISPSTVASLLRIFAFFGLPQHAARIAQTHAKRGHAIPCSVDELEQMTREAGGDFTELANALQTLEKGDTPHPSPAASDVAAAQRKQWMVMHRRLERKKRRRLPRPRKDQIEAAAVRELVRNAPFGGDRMIHKYVAISQG
eukprot:Sspe_Gene.91937::Locus_63603_Transcript_1_1_Confidence_1.000_Length_1410::g.91937::m.91937